MPPTFFGCLPRQKIDQKRHLSSRLSRIHFCDLIHGGGLVFGLHAIVASPAGRDQSRDDASRGRKHFNPRVSCGTRLLVGSPYSDLYVFLPTRPLRDATIFTPPLVPPSNISTHASLAGRDKAVKSRVPFGCDFYPRVPCGTRLNWGGISKDLC